MKINIRKMQSGGSMGSSAQAYGFLDYVPFIAQQPVNPYVQPVNTQQISTKSETTSKDKKEEDLIPKEIFSTLLKGGLKSDVDAFLVKLGNLYNVRDQMIAQASDPFNPESTKINTSWLERQQLGIISDLVKIRDNKEIFDNAMKAAGEAGALNEVALDANGDMMVVITDKGKVAHIDADFYSKHRDKFKPITNKELASLRNNDMRLAFHNDSLTVLQGAVGSKEVDEVIRNIINEAEYSSQSSVNYIKGDDKQAIKQGLQLLKDGVYKKSETYKNNSKQINAALQYLYKNLQPQYRKFLEAKAAINGDDPKKGSIDLIVQYANARELNEYNYDLDYEASASKDATDSSGKSGKSSSNNEIKNTLLMSLYNGYGASKQKIKFNPGSNYQSSVTGIHLNMIPTAEGKTIPSNTTLKTVLDESLRSLASEDFVFLGDQKISPQNLDKIIYTYGGISRVKIPILENGDPDFEIIKKYEKALEEVKKLGNNPNPKDILNIFNTKGLSDYILLNGELNEDRFGSYFILNGMGSTEKGVLNEDEMFSNYLAPLKEIYRDKESRQEIQKTFQNAASVRISENEKYIYNPDINDIYLGPIYIKDVGNDMVAGMVSGVDPKINGKKADEWSAAIETQNKANSTSSSLLGF